MASSTFAELAPPEIKTVLKERFPGWSFVHSNVDRWWAFRHRKSPATGLRVDVDADTPEQLADKLDKINGRLAAQR